MKNIIKLRKYIFRLKALIMSLILVGLINIGAYAQDQKISGTILDETGAGLPGASVLIKGTSTGTVTDMEGKYSISAKSSDILVISFIGYSSQELTVGSKSVINVNLDLDAAQLAEVIVTGYSSESKKTITGSIDALNTKKAFAIPSTSAAEGFQGRLTGVTVIAAGQPGQAPIVRIRGVATTGNNDPLYIIDGFQTNDPNFLNDLNTSDIESVTVLKDAAVASVYGARATNGVIVIKTRKGAYTQGGGPKVTLDMSYGVQKPVTAPKMLNSQQLGEVFWESRANDGHSTEHPQFGLGETPNISGYYRGDPSLPYDANTNRLTRTSPGTDWFDEIFNDASYQNYYLSVNGGSEKSKYMMSLGYMNREGILKYTDYERYTARANTEFSVKDNIRVGQNISASFSKQLIFPGNNGDESPIALSYRASPLIPVRDEGGNFAGTYRSAAGLNNAQNPLAVMTRAKDNNNNNLRFYGDTYAEVDIVDGLTARSNIGIQYQTGTGDVFNSLNPEHAEAIGTNALSTGRFINSGYVWTNTLRYEKKISDDHFISVVGGIEAIQNHSEFTVVTQTGFPQNDEVDSRLLGFGVGAVTIGNSSNSTNSLYSYFGQLKYSFQEKYIITGTIRRDKTSAFLPGNNTGVFPAFSAGWLVSEESFIPDMISNLKVRGSYGLMGNQSVPSATPSVNVNAYNNSTSFYNFGGAYTPGASLTSAGNPNLKWESSQQINIGMNLGLLKNDLELVVDYFQLTSKNNLIAVPVPTTNGAALAAPPYINNGEIKNSGIEISLNYGNKSATSDFKYNVGLKFSKYKNEIIATDEKNTSIVGGNIRGVTFTNSQVGGPVSSFYGRKVIGIFRSAEEVSAAPDQGFDTPAAGVGRFQYADISGADGVPDGKIDDLDRTNLGSPNPSFTYGINLDLEYKGFDLSLFFTGSKGNEIYNYTKYLTHFPTFYNSNRSVDVLDSFHPTKNPNGQFVALSESVTNSEASPNSFFVEDGSYMRLKNLQIGYTLPTEVIGKVGLSRARIYVQGSNIFTITNYSGLDPEIGRFNNTDIDTGIDFGSFPTSRTYLIGVSIDF